MEEGSGVERWRWDALRWPRWGTVEEGDGVEEENEGMGRRQSGGGGGGHSEEAVWLGR